MTSDSKPIPYTQSAASLEVPPPYRFPGVHAYAFVWEAQLGPIQAFCDKFLNLGSGEKRGFVYRPATFWPYALMLFIDYPYMFSRCPPPKGEPAYGQRGYVSQTEVFVALPVWRSGLTDKTRLEDAEMEWALPFIVVADAMSAVSGREMIGLPKLLASITADEAPGTFTGRVKMLGWPDDDPATQQEMMRFLTVEAKPSMSAAQPSPAHTSPWTVLPDRLSGMFMENLAIAREIADVATLGLMPLAMRMVSLRQYRAAEAVTKAVYQAIVSCRFSYRNIRNFSFYNEKNVEIRFHDVGSFSRIIRVFRDIGDGSEPPREDYVIQPTAAFRFDADIDLDDMRTVHTFASPYALPPEQSSAATSSWARAWQGFWPPRS